MSIIQQTIMKAKTQVEIGLIIFTYFAIRILINI